MSKLGVLLLMPVLSITFYLPVNSVNCLQGNIHKDLLVLGNYKVDEDPKTRTNLKITDSLGDTLYTKENATKGTFSFITESYDQFDVCFNSISPMGTGRVPDQLVVLKLKHGVEAENTGSTNTQLQLFSVVSVCCFLALAAWQILYLKRFFKTKKLIE